MGYGVDKITAPVQKTIGTLQKFQNTYSFKPYSTSANIFLEDKPGIIFSSYTDVY